MGALNSQALAQAQLAQQNQQFNAGNINQANQTQAGFYQQAGLTNAGAANQYGLQQGQMNQGTNLANLQSQLGTNQLNAQQYNEYMQNLQQQTLAQYQAQMQGQAASLQAQLGNNQINAGVAQNNANQAGNMFGSAVGAAGLGLMMMSDERVKRNIINANPYLDKLLRKFTF